MKTSNTITITVNDNKHANRLVTALKNLKTQASVGGDLELMARSNHNLTQLGHIGSDVEIGQLLDILRSTVQYRRTSSFERFLEEHADEWDDYFFHSYS